MADHHSTMEREAPEAHAAPPSPNLVVGLLRELRDEMQTLLHQELVLVKTEMAEKVELDDELRPGEPLCEPGPRG